MSTPFYDLASLVVVPSGYKSGKVYAQKPQTTDGQLTFTRASSATRVASNGLIEKVRTNLALRSQEFATAAVWTATNGTLTNNAGTAPDGTNTASKIVATDTDPFCYQSITLTGPVVASCYVKAVGSAIGKSAEIRAGVSLTAFTLSGSWQRVFVTHTASAAHNYGLEVPNPGVIGDEVLLWGFQVEGGDIATAYIPTTTAAVSVGPVSGLPRLDYLNSTCPKLLLEPQRTNVLTFSEQLNNAAWGNAGGTTTANTAVSPSGYQDADTLTGARFQSSFASNTYTLSAFAKKVDGDGTFTLRLDVPANKTAVFNLNNGTIVSTDAGYSSSITAYGNGWYRCTFTSPASTTIFNAVLVSANAGVSNTFVYGCQLEVGAYATSYIPTLAASVTRVADAASKTGISSLIGQTEGVMFVDINRNYITSSYDRYFAVDDADATIYRTGIYLFPEPSIDGRIYLSIRNNNTAIYEYTYNNTTMARLKIAMAYKSGDIAYYINGTQVATSSATFTFAHTLSRVLSSGVGQSVNQTLLFNTRLTNAQLAELTAL